MVVSPEGFGREDLILCAITSQVPQTPSAWEVPLGESDMAEGELPKKSIIKAGKLFTMHERLVATRFGAVRDQKLQEVLVVLRGLFTLERATDDVPNDAQKAEFEPN